MTPFKSQSQRIKLPDFAGDFRYAIFAEESACQEIFLTFCPTRYASFATQLQWLEQAYEEALKQLEVGPEQAVFKRFLCSDITNQMPQLAALPFSNPNHPNSGAVAVVQQPPLAPAKVALTVYLLKERARSTTICKQGRQTIVSRPNGQHIWSTGAYSVAAESSFAQSHSLFANYLTSLAQQELTLAQHVIRTWFYVKDVDSNYQGLVDARNEVFAKEGLTAQTHYIASTGIEGAHANPAAEVMLDAYAIKGVKPEQIRYLNALDHLGYTHDYGVAFERATAVSYQDRQHIFISGTASIDPQGEIVHVNDVEQQLHRTLANITALLADANATLANLQQCIVYVRDVADCHVIQQTLQQLMPLLPFVVVLAPVCRPGWLLEIEGIACLAHHQPELPHY